MHFKHANLIRITKLPYHFRFAGLPLSLHSPTGTDLGSQDLALFMSLIDKATDDEFLQSRNLRAPRRTSRSAEIPAQGLVRALQTAVSSSYLQKLAADKTDSASGDDGAEGVLLAFTPALADEDSAKLFVGSEAYTAAGSLPAAIAQQLPAKLVTGASALSVRFCWLSADEGVSVDRVSEFKPLSDAIKHLFKINAVLPAAVATLPSLDWPAFAALLSLPCEPEAASNMSSTIDELWPTDDASLDTLKVLVSSLERPYAGRATDEGKPKLKVARTNKNAKKTAGADGASDPAVDGVGKTGRGQRLREKALKQRTEISIRSGGQLLRADSLPAVPAVIGVETKNTVANIEAEPLTMDQAITMVSTGLKSIVERLIKEGSSPLQRLLPAVAAQPLAESVQKLVSTAFNGVLAHEAISCEDLNDALDLADVRIALGSRAVIPAAEFKAQHAARVPYEMQVVFTWTCAAQVLLRMAIASHGITTSTTGGTSTTQGRFDSATYTEILNLLQIVVATMQPIPSGGQTFFREGVKPRFGSAVLAPDVRRLEATLWEDEDMDDVDADGGLAALRVKATSLEASGETPEAPGNKVATVSHADDAGIEEKKKINNEKPAPVPAVAAAGGSNGNRRGPLLALLPRAGAARNHTVNNRNGSESQNPTGSVGNASHSLRSADGSGVNGSVSVANAGATAATRKAGSLTDAEFLSRRYANSKQYSMQLRVGGAPQTSRAKQIAAVAAGGIMSHQAAPTSKLTRPGGGKGAGGSNNAAAADGAGHNQLAKNRVAGPNGNRGGAGTKAAGTSRAASPLRKERLPRAVPDTPQGDHEGDNAPTASAAAKAGAVGGNNTKRTAAAPRQLFTVDNVAAAAAGPVPATLEAIPNTTPREMRAVARTAPGIGASPLRQNLFGIPGAIIPTTQEEREDVDMSNAAGATTAATVPAARATWFTGAVVPRGNVTRPTQQHVAAAAVLEVPVPEAAVKPTRNVEKAQEMDVVEEPAAAAAAVPIGVATRRSSTPIVSAAAAVVSAGEQKGKADVINPREQRRQTRASAAAVEDVVEPKKPIAAAVQRKGAKGEKTGAVEEVAAPVVERTQPRKRTRSTAVVTEEPASSQPAPAPSKRRASSRLQQASKSAAPAPTTTRTSARAAARKNEEPEVVSPPAASDAIAAIAVAAHPQPEPVVAKSPAVPAELDFQTIMAAAVVVNDTAEVAPVASPAVPAVEKEPEQVDEPAAATTAAVEAMPSPPPPVLAPEAVPPPPPPAPLFSPPALVERAVVSPPMVTPVTAPAPTPSHGRTISVLGKRSLAGLTGRTPATKRGRLGNMLAVGAKPNVRSMPKATDISPRQYEIQDIGSPTKPTKPSPYADDFALPVNSPGRKGKKKGIGAGASGKPSRGGGAAKNPKVVKKMDLSQHRRVAAVAAAAEPTDSSAGESIGDAPAPSAGNETETAATAAAAAVAAVAAATMKTQRLTSKLKPLSPLQQSDEADSDAEDEAMLQAAANGDLSPPPGSFEEHDDEATAANASVLETTPAAENDEVNSDQEVEEEDVVATRNPRSKGRGGKAGAAAGATTAAAPKAKKTVTKRASRSVWTKSKKKRKITRPTDKQLQQLRMSKLAARQEKATGVEGAPAIGDDIKCIMPTSTGHAVTIHCQIIRIESTVKDRRGGWVCKAEVQPITNIHEESSSQRQFAVLSFMVQLHSAQLRAWEAELHSAGEWAHMQALDASPLGAHPGAGACGEYMAPAETARHNAAARNQERDSLDSVPVLPSTAERLRSKAKAVNKFLSPRIMRPVHLDMDRAVAAVGNGGVQTTLPAAMAAAVTSAMKAARRDSISSGGSYGLQQGMVSPAAHAAAMGMLGALYRGGTPQPPHSVEEQLQAAFSPQSQWATTPHAAMA